jgi:hypothetical protein
MTRRRLAPHMGMLNDIAASNPCYATTVLDDIESQSSCLAMLTDGESQNTKLSVVIVRRDNVRYKGSRA